MSIRVMAMVWQIPLDPSSKLVLMAMADHANDDGRSIYPGNARLCGKTSLSLRMLQYNLKHLEDHGLVKRERFPGGGKGKAVEWAINLELLETMQSTAPFGNRATHCTLSREGCNLGPQTVQPIAPQPPRTTQTDYISFSLRKHASSRESCFARESGPEEEKPLAGKETQLNIKLGTTETEKTSGGVRLKVLSPASEEHRAWAQEREQEEQVEELERQIARALAKESSCTRCSAGIKEGWIRRLSLVQGKQMERVYEGWSAAHPAPPPTPPSPKETQQ